MRARILLLLFLGGCTHPLENPLELETRVRNDEARAMLAKADFDSARELYRTVLDADASDPEAAFGFVLSDLLMAPLWEPVKELFGRCFQPRFDLSIEVFGEQGVLAREAKAKAGTSNLEIFHFPRVTSGATKLDFQPTSIKAEIYTERDGSRRVELRLYDARRADGAFVAVVLNPDDLTKNDGSNIVPAADGAVVSLHELDGSVSIFDPSRLDPTSLAYVSSYPLEGSLHVLRAGRAPGESIAVSLDGIRLPADCLDPSCSASYELRGQIQDVISERVDFRPEAFPFYGVEADPSSPRRSAEIVAIEQCSATEASFVLAKVRQVGDRLAEDAAILEAAANAEAEFSFSVPKQLLYAERDLVLSVTDARVLRGLMLLGAGLIELVSQWQVADGSIQDMISTYWFFEDPTGTMLETVSIRDFEPRLVVEKLGRKLLERAPNFDLTQVKVRFDEGLRAVFLAIDDRTLDAEGIFDFSASSSGRLFADLASAASLMRASLDSGGPLTWSDAELYRFHLGALFEEPLDRHKIYAGTRVNHLLSLEPGDGTSNDRVVWEGEKFWIEARAFFDGSAADLDLVETWIGEAIDLPVNKSEQTCVQSSECGQGYSCPRGQCVAELPYLFTRTALESAVRDEWPVFLNPGVRDAFDF
jgi:hypothetical protein